MRMRWGLVLLITLLLGLGLSKRAHAGVIRDEAFSIDLGDARVCFVLPNELKTEDDCVGLPEINPPANADAKRHDIAAGILRVPGSRTSARLYGLVSARRTDMSNASEPTAENKDSLVTLVTNDVNTKLPPGLTLKMPPTSRLEKVGEMTVLRVSLDLVGQAPNPDDELVETQRHRELIMVLLRDASYVVEWHAAPQNATAIARMADAAVPTIRVDSQRLVPKTRQSVVSSLSQSLSLPVMIALGFGVVVIVVIGLMLQSGKARRRAAGGSSSSSSFSAELWPPHDS